MIRFTPQGSAAAVVLYLVSPVVAQSRLPQPSHAAGAGPSPTTVTLDAAAYPSLSALADACNAATAPGQTCLVNVRTHTVLQLAGVTHVPVGLHLRFEPGGLLELPSGTLDFGGSTVDAPPAPEQIFAGPGSVTGLNEAHPEWFVPATMGAVPAAALVAAYRATVTWGTIRLEARSYVSPFTGGPNWPAPPSSIPQILYDTPRSFLGAGRPLPDSDTAPTHLSGGTILLGQVLGTAPMVAVHLGVDDGPDAAAQYFDGFRGYGLVLAGTGKLQGTGSRFEDVSVLTTNAVSQHSVMIEAQSNAVIQGLWIWSLGGLHGLVIKSSHSTINDFHCKGAGSDCLVIKSDFDTSFAGYASDDSFSGIHISYLKTPGDTGGIAVDSTWDTVHDVTLSNVHLDGLARGIDLSGSMLHRLRDFHIDHFTARQMTGHCLDSLHVDRVDISDFDCSLTPAPIAAAVILGSPGMRLANIRLSCAGTPEACRKAGTAGLLVASRGVHLESVQGTQLGGPLVEAVYPLTEADRAQLSMIAMAGPLVASYKAPHQSLPAHLRTYKPPLRIVYTYVITRLNRCGIPPWTAVVLGLLLIVPFIYGPKHRRRTVDRR